MKFKDIYTEPEDMTTYRALVNTIQDELSKAKDDMTFMILNHSDVVSIKKQYNYIVELVEFNDMVVGNLINIGK